MCFQTADLLAAMKADWREGEGAQKILRVDGGMANSDWTMQRLADLLGSTVDRPEIKETTALGAAYLAGLHAGFFPEPDRFADHWRLERRFLPQMDAAMRAAEIVRMDFGGRADCSLKVPVQHRSTQAKLLRRNEKLCGKFASNWPELHFRLPR